MMNQLVERAAKRGDQGGFMGRPNSRLILYTGIMPAGRWIGICASLQILQGGLVFA